MRITIEVNRKIINFLDITLDLSSGTHKPYNKPGNIPLYVHQNSNHPPSVVCNIPLSINKRLSILSSNEQCFNSESHIYQKALEDSGYSHKLKYEKQNPHRRKHRKRNIVWFNPPFSKNVATDVGRKFLSTIKRIFHNKHTLHKLFNKNNLKLSFSCMPNIATTISKENKRKLYKEPGSLQNDASTRTCNCRVKKDCPMNGECLESKIIYQATVKTESSSSTYIGLSEPPFKSRYSNHMTSFRHERYINSTELSKHVWDLKNKNMNYDINWKIISKASTYNPTSRRCQLCLSEKYFIICRPELGTLNKRSELVSTCRHSFKQLLCNT